MFRGLAGCPGAGKSQNHLTPKRSPAAVCHSVLTRAPKPWEAGVGYLRAPSCSHLTWLSVSPVKRVWWVFFLFACFLLKTALVTTQKTIPNRPVLLGNKRNSGGNGESKEIHRAGNGPQVAVKTRVFSAGMRSLMSPHGPSSTPRPTSAPRLGRVGGKVWGSEVLPGLRLGTCGLESPSAFTGLSARFPKSSD